MKLFRSMSLFLILSSMITSPISAESRVADGYYYHDEDKESAYSESTNSAHWSAYAPIGVLVVAAVLFGVADGYSTGYSNRSGGGNGRMKSSYSKSHKHTKHCSAHTHS